MQGEDADAVIRFIVAQRRGARAERKLPTYAELQAQRAADAAAPPPQPPVPVPPSKGAAPSMPVSMNPVAPSFQPGGKAQATKPTAPPPRAVAPPAPDRTFEDAEKWLRSAQNPNAGLQAIPQVWVGVTDLYVLLLKTTSTFETHYKKRTSFLLSDQLFPQFKVRQFHFCINGADCMSTDCKGLSTAIRSAADDQQCPFVGTSVRNVLPSNM